MIDYLQPFELLQRKALYTYFLLLLIYWDWTQNVRLAFRRAINPWVAKNYCDKSHSVICSRFTNSAINGEKFLQGFLVILKLQNY